MLKMQYQIVSHDCDSCRYAMHALQLLNIAFTSKTLSQVLQTIAKNTADANQVVFLCKESYLKASKEEQKKLSNSTAILLVDEQYAGNVDKSFYVLPVPFDIHAFKKLLLSVNSSNQNKQFDDHFVGLVGASKSMVGIKDIIMKVASCDSSVLISGETGTGKDVVANAIHALSKRSKYPFVPMNCGAIPNELIESELFGHEKGAFTGAYTKKIGRFEYADKGTIFLDEIGDMPFSLQVKLLRIIQDKAFERVGSHEVIHTDTRIIAATNKDLETEVSAGKFREDLYYRLNVISIELPKLRERPDDIPLLVEHFLNKISERVGHSITFTNDAIAMMANYAWPGNIRELANFLERMVILNKDEMINSDKLIENYPRMSKGDPILDIFDQDLVPSMAMS